MQKIRSNWIKQCEARLVPTSFHADCGSKPLSSGSDAFLWAQSVTECYKILQSITRYWKVLQRCEPLSPAAKMPFSGILSPTPALAISPLQTFTRQQLKYCKIIWTWPAHWEDKVSRLLFWWRLQPLRFPSSSGTLRNHPVPNLHLHKGFWIQKERKLVLESCRKIIL